MQRSALVGFAKCLVGVDGASDVGLVVTIQ